MERKFDPVQGSSVSLSELNRQARALSAHAKLTVAPPLELSHHGNAIHLRLAATFVGGSTGVELIRINPPTFYLGTGGVTLCFYDGTLYAPTVAAGWAATSTNVWWVTKYADALVDPLPGQVNMTVVTVDGTKGYPGKFYGESYDPVDAFGSHVGSRPVYWWPGSAWGILEACDDSGGVPVVVLDLEG